LYVFQIAIEIKRFLVKRLEEHADQVAIAALRQIEEAIKKLENDQSSVNPSSPSYVIKLAWQEELNISCNPHLKNRMQISERSIKFGRTAIMLTIVPLMLFGVGSTLDNINHIRPHGVTGVTLFLSGIVYPLMFILYNVKLRQFSIAYITDNFWSTCMKRIDLAIL